MKYVLLICMLPLLVSILPSVVSAELDEHLKALEPLLDKNWAGGYVGTDAPDIEITLRFEQILDGNAVRYTREAPDVKFSALTHFYWNPGLKKVCFVSLTNRGIVGEGVVTFEDDKIVLRGKNFWQNKTTESRTTLEIGPKGTLTDTFTRVENGEWVPGHVQEFTVK